MSQPVVRVYQEDWWPFQNLPHALREFERQTGIKTELSWDKVGVGLIEAMFEHMIHSFTDDDPPYDLICTDEILLRRFAAEGRVLVAERSHGARRRHARRRDAGDAPRRDARRQR